MTESIFLVFGLGLFLFTMHMISRDHREAHDRRIMELSELGYRDENETRKKRFRKK